jgi:hypothetical protein
VTERYGRLSEAEALARFSGLFRGGTAAEGDDREEAITPEEIGALLAFLRERRRRSVE